MQWQLVYPVMKKELPMKALIDLFSTDYGLFSVAVIVFMLVMMWYLFSMFIRKMNEGEAANRK